MRHRLSIRAWTRPPAPGVHGRRTRRDRPRRRPRRAVPRWYRGLARGGGRRPQRHGGHHGHPRRPAVGAHGAAAPLGRRGLRVLHQPRQPQGARAGRQPPGGAAVPLASGRPPGDRRGHGGPGDDEASDAYWATRPRGSQIAAHGLAAEPGGRRPGRARAPLGRGGAASRGRSRVPRPTTGADSSCRPERVEFWQGRENRLHDRLVYRRDITGSSGWRIERLAP